MRVIEQRKFLAWHANEVKAGLIDINFYVGKGSRGDKATTEEFFCEVNLVNDLYVNKQFIHRPDVF